MENNNEETKEKAKKIRKTKEELQKELETCEAKVQEYKEIAQRIQADFENYKKMTEKRYEEQKRYLNVELIRQLLPILDSLDEAIATTEKTENLTKKDFLDGLVNLRKQFFKILQDNGVKEVNTEGQFDHWIHECVLLKNDPNIENDTITKVIRKGYMINGKLLRPAMVEVNKINKENTDNSEVIDNNKEESK
ncbi:MAG: nucleotide exchange factor GrpE [Candidatus Diapherotrites archaeon]|nr:nucleotide exchange factor GrpE [Candidatus Diapherotrites archaeon]